MKAAHVVALAAVGGVAYYVWRSRQAAKRDPVDQVAVDPVVDALASVRDGVGGLLGGFFGGSSAPADGDEGAAPANPLGGFLGAVFAPFTTPKPPERTP